MNALSPCTFIVVVLISFRVDLSQSMCPPTNPNDGTVSTYVPINETLYDRNYSRIDSGRHPLGFYAGTWLYNQGETNPCIKIAAPNAGASMLEIKVETVPPARLCVQDQISDRQCFQGMFSYCDETPGNTIYVEFLCDSQCEEADVNFWYRLVLSPPDAVDWCLHRNNLFPGDLATLPPGVTLPPYTTPGPSDGTGKASQGASSSRFVLAAALLILSGVL